MLQNTSLQMANSLQTPMVFSILMIESMYYPPVIFTHVFFSITIITSLLATLVKIKHWNLFTADISGLAFRLIYNNSASLVSLVCNLSYNVTSTMNLSNNSLFLNNHGILFLWTLSRNFHHSLDLTLSWS